MVPAELGGLDRGRPHTVGAGSAAEGVVDCDGARLLADVAGELVDEAVH